MTSAKKDDEKKHSLRGINDVEIFNLNIDNILPYEKQGRKNFLEDDIKGLADSISEVGVINPIQVIKNEKQGFFNVVNGERRLRAAQKLGLKTIPSIIIENNSKTELISVIDNIQRQDLHPVELAGAISSLVHNYGDKKDIAEKLGLPYTSVLENLKLLELPLEVRDELINKNISSRAIFRKIMKQKDKDSMLNILSNKKVKAVEHKKKKSKIFDCYISNGSLEFNLDSNKISKEQIKKIISYLEEKL